MTTFAATVLPSMLAVVAAAALIEWLRRARCRRPAAAPSKVAGWYLRACRLAGVGSRRERAALVAGLPPLLEEVASARRAGTALPLALHEASRGPAGAGNDPARQRLHAALEPAGRGQPLAAALAHWRDVAEGPDERLAASTLALAASVGSADAAAFDAAASALRDRRSLAEEVRTQSAQARASAAVLTLLPPGFLLVSSLQDPRVAAFLRHSPAGWACLATGLALDGVGAWWMARMVRGVIR